MSNLNLMEFDWESGFVPVMEEFEKFRFSDEDLEKIGLVASRGVSESTIGHLLGVPPNVFKLLLKMDPRGLKVIYQKKAETTVRIAGALIENALDGNYNAQKLWLKTKDREERNRNWDEVDQVAQEPLENNRPKLVISLSGTETDNVIEHEG